MLRALSSLLALMMAAPTTGQTTQVTQFASPCPAVFTYDLMGVESNKWNGVVTLNTDTTLYALWLNIVLDSKANILGNWVGEVTTDNNLDFKIENTKMTIKPGTLAIPFFVQYKVGDKVPKLVAIRFNGKEICQVETPQVVERIDPVKEIDYEEVRPAVTTTTTIRPRETTTLRDYNTQQTTNAQTEEPETTTNSLLTSLPPQYWPDAQATESTSRTTQYWQQTTSTFKPLYWTQATTEVKPHTTVRNPIWPYVKDQQVSIVEPTNQTWSKTRTEAAPRNTTEQNLVTKVQGWSSSQSQTNDTTDRTQNTQTQVQNKQHTTSENRYKAQNETNQKGEGFPPNWSNVAEETVNQSVGPTKTRPNNLPKEQVGEKKHWSEIPAENITGSPVNVPSGIGSIYDGWSANQQRWPDSGLQTQPYAQISITQAQSLPPQNYNQATDASLYVRPEDRQTISSTYNVDNRPQTYSGIGSQNRQPVDPYQHTTQQRPQNTGNIGPVQWTGENNAQTQTIWTGDEYKTWVEPTSYGVVTGYISPDGRIVTSDGSGLTFEQPTAEPPAPAPTKIENDAPKQEEYYDGGLPIFYIPNHGHQIKVEPTCGKVVIHQDKGVNLESTETEEGQWPWQIALYQQQTSVDFRYICGGTLVSKRHVITAAHCVTRRKSARLVNKNTLTVYLGKHNLRNSVEGVQVKFVNRILLYPEYDANTFRSDLAILELRDFVTYSDWIQPACIWPEQEADLQNIVGQTGSIPGWGYDVTGVARTELTLLHMTVVDQETCISSHPDFFRVYTSDRTFCAGYRSYGAACNGDSGGGMFFQKGNSWYLRGVVSLSVARQGSFGCGPNQYVIFTDAAKFYSWIQGNIEDCI